MEVFAGWVIFGLICLGFKFFSEWQPGNERRNDAIKEGRDRYLGSDGKFHDLK